MPTVSGYQDELRGSAAVRRCASSGVPTLADDAAGSARVPDLAVLFVGGGLGDDGLGDALPRRKPPTALGLGSPVAVLPGWLWRVLPALPGLLMPC